MKLSFQINSRITALFSTGSNKQNQVYWVGGVTKDVNDIKGTPQNEIISIMLMKLTAEFTYNSANPEYTRF